MFGCTIELCFYVGVKAFWQQILPEDQGEIWPHSLDSSTWVPLVSASLELRAQLNIFQFNVLFNPCFLGSRLHRWSSVWPVFLCFSKSAWTAHLETPVCFECLSGGDLTDAVELPGFVAEFYHYSYLERILIFSIPAYNFCTVQYIVTILLQFKFHTCRWKWQICVSLCHTWLMSQSFCIGTEVGWICFWTSMPAFSEEFKYNDRILFSNISFTYCWSCHGYTSSFFLNSKVETEN